eukprot:COSAG05_NODE_4823_length_1358_cov_1.417792_3_plen_50_part_01
MFWQNADIVDSVQPTRCSAAAFLPEHSAHGPKPSQRLLSHNVRNAAAHCD